MISITTNEYTDCPGVYPYFWNAKTYYEKNSPLRSKFLMLLVALSGHCRPRCQGQELIPEERNLVLDYSDDFADFDLLPVTRKSG